MPGLVASSGAVKLYRAPMLPNHWVGNDKRGGLVTWPAKEHGWDERTPYDGPRRGLVEVAPALARGTGWPGGGTGRKPASESGQPGENRTIRVPADEWKAWDEHAKAEGQTRSDWIRKACEAAMRRAKR